jgi:hypothetical protein
VATFHCIEPLTSTRKMTQGSQYLKDRAWEGNDRNQGRTITTPCAPPVAATNSQATGRPGYQPQVLPLHMLYAARGLRVPRNHCAVSYTFLHMHNGEHDTLTPSSFALTFTLLIPRHYAPRASPAACCRRRISRVIVPWASSAATSVVGCIIMR